MIVLIETSFFPLGTQLNDLEPHTVVDAPCTPINSSTCPWVKLQHQQVVLYESFYDASCLLLLFFLDHSKHILFPLGARPRGFTVSSW